MQKLLAVFILSIATLTVQAQPKNIVITQVFGAGGLTNSPLSHDFVELYNPTDKTVTLDGWSIQYSPATTDRWATGTVKLAGSMAPGTYYLIQLNGKEGIGRALPTPDLIANVNVDVSATNGKVALVNSIVALESNCPVNSSIVDFVGFGTADCFEMAAAPPTSNTKSIMRLNNGCTDTDDNASDFTAVTPGPRNSSAPANVCNGATITISSITPNPICIDNTNGASGTIGYMASGSFANAQFKAVLSDAAGSFTNPVVVGSLVVDGNNPSGNIAIQIPKGLTTSKTYRIRIDATNPSLTGVPTSVEIINGAANLNLFTASPNADRVILNWTNPSGCFSEILIVAKEGASITEVPTGDGSTYSADLNLNGNGSPFNGGKVIYKGTTSGQTVTGLETGKEYYFKAFTRNGTHWSSGIEIRVKARLLPLPGEILINQMSPQYDSASYEYIELVNTTGKTFDLSELSISVHAASGNKSVAGNTLTGLLQPHSYWLLSSKEVVRVGKTNLTRDGYIADGIAATASQIALLRKTDSTVIDGFGYGAIQTKTYTETTPAAAPTTKGGFKRKVEGFDTNNNNADFEKVANADIDLKNSSSRLANKDAVIMGGDYARLYITGNAKLTGNANFNEKVVLQNGVLQLESSHIATPKTEGGHSGSYIQTNSTGTLTLQRGGEANTLLPIGNKTYNPVTITNGGGVDWRASVLDDVVPPPALFKEEKAVLRTWQLTPSSTPATGSTIMFYYNDEDPTQTGAAFNKAEVQVWNYNNDWTPVGARQKPDFINGMQAVSVTGWKTAGTFAIANPVAEASQYTVLPIRFMDVKATELPHAIQINFTNATESDVAVYHIERSGNGTEFKSIGTLQPVHNNGSLATYQWLDRTRPSGNLYYRIKGVEKDGKEVLSSILQIKVGNNANAFTVFPNPAKGGVLTWQANLPKGVYKVRISNSNGQQVMEKNVDHPGGNLSEVLQLPGHIRSGVYTLQVSNGNYSKVQSIIVL